jgi:hypothetical protein
MPSNQDGVPLPAEQIPTPDTADAEALHRALEQLEHWLALEQAEVARIAAERERLNGERTRMAAERDTHERVTEQALSESRQDAARRALAELVPLKRRLHELDLHLKGVTRHRTRLQTSAEEHALALERLRRRCQASLGMRWIDLAVPSLKTLEKTASAEEIELELLRRRARPTAATAPPECSPLSAQASGRCKLSEACETRPAGEGSETGP